MSKPFDYVNAILYGKKQMIVDELTEKEYVPFLVNRSLSFHNDCIMYANEMNRRHFLDKKLQNDFLLNTIRSRKRPFAKWIKSEKSADVDLIKLAYGLSNSKAIESLRLISEKDIKLLREKFDIGG
jgi:hypothetical protein